MQVIKLFQADGNVNYISDILNVVVDKESKKVTIIDTVEKEYTITYTKDNLFDILVGKIDMNGMNNVPVEIYENENDLAATLFESAGNQQQLIQQLAEGNNVNIDRNITLNQQIEVDGENTIIKVDDSVINNTEDIWATNKYALVNCKGGNLTIDGTGTFKAKENDCYAADVTKGGNLTIKGNINFIGNIHSVYAMEGTITIEGGFFDIQQLEKGDDGYRLLLNCLDKNYKNGTANIIVKGGQFVNFDPGNNTAEGPNTNFLAAGYISTPEVIGGRTIYTVTKDPNYVEPTPEPPTEPEVQP